MRGERGFTPILHCQIAAKRCPEPLRLAAPGRLPAGAASRWTTGQPFEPEHLAALPGPAARPRAHPVQNAVIVEHFPDLQLRVGLKILRKITREPAHGSGLPLNFVPEEAREAARRPLQSRERAHQGGLVRPVGAKQPKQALADLQIRFIQRLDTPNGPMQPNLVEILRDS